MVTVPKVDVQSIYTHHIRMLPYDQRLLLLSMIAQDLLDDSSLPLMNHSPIHSIMELHGLGKDLWKDVDVEEYINNLREEWGHRV